MPSEVWDSHFAYAEGEPVPWHVVTGSANDNMVGRRYLYDVEYCMRRAGMALTFHKEKVGLLTEQSGARGREVPGLYSVVCDQDGRIVPGVGVGETYELLQPTRAFQFVRPFLESMSVRFSCAGMLKSGRRYFITCKVEAGSGATAEVVPGDPVRGYFVFATSLDGSLVTHVAFSAIRPLCQNTLSMMVADANGAVKSAEASRTTHALRIRHTKAQELRLDEVARVLDFQARSFVATVEQYRRLAQVGCLGDDLRRYVSIALEFPEGKTLSTRGANIVDKVCELATHGRGSEVAGVAGTLWGAWNGVTDYLSHEAGRTVENRVDSVLFGEASRKSARALDQALELAAAAA